MVKGRNTTIISVRVGDAVLDNMRGMASKRKVSFSDYLRSLFATYWKMPVSVPSEDPPLVPSQKASLRSRQSAKPSTPIVPKVSRNAPCPCGSGLKYKRCHACKE